MLLLYAHHLQLLISDMSSNFISKPVDVSKYGIIYAGEGIQHLGMLTKLLLVDLSSEPLAYTALHPQLLQVLRRTLVQQV
jgi:phosphoserine aminotransferase